MPAACGCASTSPTAKPNRTGGDPVIGLKVDSVVKTLAALGMVADVKTTDRGAYVELRDPDGHVVILTEAD